MKKYLFLLLVAAVAMTPSCRKMADEARENVKLEAIESIKLRGLSAVDATVRIKNDTDYTLALNSANVTLYYGDDAVARATLSEGVELAGHTTASLHTSWRLKILSPLTLYVVARKALAGDISQMTLSGTVEGRGGPMPVKISREKMPLSEFLDIFGLTMDDLKRNLTL